MKHDVWGMRGDVCHVCTFCKGTGHTEYRSFWRFWKRYCVGECVNCSGSGKITLTPPCKPPKPRTIMLREGQSPPTLRESE